MKAYRTIPITECGEPLVPIQKGLFPLFDPPPYVACGAPYGDASPWMLRKGVAEALTRAQEKLITRCPGWKIMIFDAYRPNEVQAFMVNREFGIKAKEAGLDPAALTPAQREKLAEKVYKYWGVPSEDPATPPPHSTGAAIDCTFMDEHGHEVDMGSPIDEGTERSDPNHFATATDTAGKQAHANRTLLAELMRNEGFHMHENEWWHFSKGDQYWAWCERESKPSNQAIAIYGRAALLK